jgi:hypothetical protein
MLLQQRTGVERSLAQRAIVLLFGLDLHLPVQTMDNPVVSLQVRSFRVEE